MLENTTNPTNTKNLVNTTVLIDVSKFIVNFFSSHWEELIVGVLVGFFLVLLKIGYDMRYKNYPERKKEHIDRLIKNILNKWKHVTCELPPNFAINRKFILLSAYKSIRKHRDFDYAVEHIKKYPCWVVWERIMKSFNNLNSSASNILDELNEAISNRLNTESFTSAINIYPSHIILDAVVKILIANLDKDCGCENYIYIDAKNGWVQTDIGAILAERGDIHDLEAFKQIICGVITSGSYQKKIRDLYLQFDTNIKEDLRTFRAQLSHISSVAEHTHRLKGMCTACPRVLWVFSP